MNQINMAQGVDSQNFMSTPPIVSGSSTPDLSGLIDIFNASKKPATPVAVAPTANDSMFSFITALVQTVADSVTRAITSVLSTVLPYLGMGGMMGGTMGMVNSGMSGMLNTGVATAEAATKEPSFMDALQVVGKKVWEVGKEYLPKIGDIYSKGKEYLSDIWGGIKGVGGAISDGASALWDGVKTAGGWIKDGISWIGSFF